MKKNKKISVLAALIFSVIVMTVFTLGAYSASDSNFEKQLSAFPESYRPYLRQLHEKYPKWTFEAFKTGLDWKTVIDNEHDDYALVYNPDAARIFKSLDADDYDAENDRFYYKDGSFVAASRVAVEYFMDPRNFLDIGGIFQFENLSFSSLYTVKMVDEVLEDSFMGNAKITWVDKKGKTQSSSKTYAQAIYEAGKTYNINPCFLASKILNEVGSQGSESVDGANKKYPGIYNFYNIGATDGAGAVERGLLWASGGTEKKTTYSRPWSTPEKSILGGAKFLAEEYIAAGQFTGYLQRFNVNPGCDYELYTHQYMSNLSGALSQGYSTYKAYREMGMLEKNLTFSIPVFEDMSNADGSGKLKSAESAEQYGVISREYRYVRTGPSVDHDILTTSKGDKVYVAKDIEVKILEKTDTDAYYFEEILTYPYWYKISFTFEKKTYTGYVPASRVTLKTITYVAKGQTDIALAKSSSLNNYIISSDPSMVKIIDGDTVNFLKNGYVTLYVYDSCGAFEEIYFRVGSYKPYYASSFKVSVSGKKATVSSEKHEKATGYAYILCDMAGNAVNPGASDKSSGTFDKLSDGAAYDVYALNRYSKYKYSKAQQKPAVVKPQKVSKLDFIKDSSGISHLSWNGVNDATGYKVSQYDEKTKKYTDISTVKFGINGYSVSAEQAKKADKYAVRAYTKYDGVTVYGDWSAVIALSSKAPTPSGFNFTDKTESGFTLNWTGNSACDGYEIYVATPEKPEPYYYKTVTETSMKVSGFKKLSLRKYKIRSFINSANGKIYSEFSPFVIGLNLPKSVSGLKLTAASNSVNISWNKHEDAAYYHLYYKTGNGSYSKVKVDSNSYTLNSLLSYTDYSVYVTVVAVKESAFSESAPCAEVAVKTLPAVPQNLRVTNQGFAYIDLAWDKNETLDFYTVSCYDSMGNVVVTTQTEENTASIKGLSPLTQYSFRITGGKRTDTLNVNSDYSAAVKSETVLPKVENFKVSNVAETSFRLTWDKIEDAVSYSLYYQKDGAFKEIAKTKKNYVTVKAVPASSKGLFYLKANYTVGDKTVSSEPTKNFTASVKPSKVTGIKVTPTATTALVSWNKVKNVNGYKIYTLENGKYVLKKTVKASVTSARIKKLKDCSYTTVCVVGYIKSTVGTAYGEYASKSFYTKPHNITEITQEKKTETSYTLKWDKPSSAVNRYYLYRVDEKTGELKRIARTSKTSYTVKDLNPGSVQRYTVMATYVKGKKVVSKSEKVCDFECATYLSKVENLALSDSAKNSVTLKWDKVKGATAYRVYYYNTSKKAFKLYKEVTDNTVVVKKIPSGKEYIFKVKAIKKTKTNTYSGYYSSNLKASAK